MDTVMLNRSEVHNLLDMDELYSKLRSGFKNYSQRSNNVGLRVRSPLKHENTSAMVLFPGLVDDIPAFTIKNHAKFPYESPAIKGVIHLHHIETGELLAIMDSTYITSIRTGMAGEMGTHLLAQKDADKVAVVGAGVQGKLQLKSLSYLRDFSEVYIYDKREENTVNMVDDMQDDIPETFHICSL
ncbi:hypothetical protein [Salinibacillus xinjiangensis]|uniref:hypothetical protein n=1 Tax=Salinibacillus xinjiangensis TaxID=1229268 RepID=UPI00189144AD|nr:hypothetical protein [Salinibacillus xinjiangensis]